MDYSILTKNKLIELCKKSKIKYSGKNRPELIKLLNENNLADTLTDENKVQAPIESKNEQEEKGVHIDVKNIDGLLFLKQVKNDTVDLILTDPPYIISKGTGMDLHYNMIESNIKNGIEFIKSEEEWEEYKTNNEISDDENKDNFLRYGTIYGKKYGKRTNYGDWDTDFNVELLEKYIQSFYLKLRKGGTLIIFFDIWKISELKNLLDKYRFKQIRFIEWIKTNPQPINSSINYLTNAREIALVAVKNGKPTFNSKYDNGIYSYPLQGGKNRFHPTQKNLNLFEDLILKHSNKGDLVIDTFLGSGTTAIACKNTGRNFSGTEISEEYYKKILTLI